jgi:peptidoglycan/LPS O-acetylase OafA/YrhL
VAVAGVLAYHAGISDVAGGMFGVDVFFVLSGFLITRLLLAEHWAAGRIRLGRFWGHRARRLLPPLLLTVAGALAYARWGGAGSLAQVRGDALAAVGYVANWRFVFSGQGYFVRYGPPSPLLHTWSLGVEEQFYLLWPLAVVVLARRGGAARVTRWAALGALSSAALMAVLHNLGVGDSRLYYGTDTRAQALLVGAVLASVLAPGGAWNNPARGASPVGAGARLSVLGWAATAGLVWLLHSVGGATGWLYDGGFLVVALASVVVVATVVVVPGGWLARGLSWRPLVALGRISYGVYLYHWPLFLWLDGARTGLAGWSLVGVRVAATLVAATVSYFLVERPIRQIGRRPSGAAGRLRRPLITATGTVVASLAVVVAATLQGVAASGQETLAAQETSLAKPPPPNPGVHTTTLIVGDSMGLTLGTGLSHQSSKWGVSMLSGAWLGCDLDPHSTVEVMGTVSAAAQGCPRWQTSWRSLVQKDNPDVVMLVMGRWEVLNRIYDGHWTHIGEADWDAHLTAELDQAIDILSARGATVVLTTLPYITGTTEQPDGQVWDMNQPSRTDAYNAVVRAAVARRPRTSEVLDLNTLIDPNGHYTSYINGIRVRNSDDEHFSILGGEYLRPFVLPELESLGTRHATGL